VRLSGAKDAVVDAELHDALFPHDVLVEEEPMTSSQFIVVWCEIKRAGRARVLHNIGPEYLAYVLAKSPLIRLAQERRDQLPVAVLSHNPEMQKSSNNSSSNISSSTNLVDQLQQSFVALQQYVNQGNNSNIWRREQWLSPTRSTSPVRGNVMYWWPS